MTSPDIPVVRPGTVAQPDQGLVDRIAQLERIVDELQRRDMRNATVGQGGTFRGFFDNGQLAFTFGKDRLDGVRKAKFYWPSTGNEAFQIGPGNLSVGEAEQMRFRDQAKHNLFATDGIAGYGLAEPSFQYLLCSIYGLNWVSGVEQVAARADAFFYNPAVFSMIQVRNYAGGVTALSGRLRVTNGETGETVTSSSTAASGANNTLRRIVLLPANFINAQNSYVEWLITPTGSGTADVWPRMCKGTSKSFYDISAGDQ
jgi:hypothetical protein